MRLEDIPPIKFDEGKHKYYDSKGKELISVTTLIHKFVKPFDKDGDIVKNCAEREGIPVKEMQKRWDDERIRSCVYGTSVHKQIEDFILTGKIENTPDKDVVEEFAKIKFNGKLYSEVRLHSAKLGIAGTTDLVEYNEKTNSCRIYDFKTNKALKKNGFKGEKMLPPLQFFESCNFNHYILQLNTYAHILEEWGFWVTSNSLTILYINPKTRKIDTHAIPDMRSEVEKMLKYYKKPPKNYDIHEDLFDFE